MSRKPRTPSTWRQDRLDHVRRALSAPVRIPREAEDKAEDEAARTERRQAVRFGPAPRGVTVDQAPAEFRPAADIQADTAKTRVA